MLPIANALFEYALTGQQFNSIKRLFHYKTFPPNLFPLNTHPKRILRARALAKFMFQCSYVLAPFHCKSLQPIWMKSLWPDILAGLQQGTDSNEGKTFVPVMMVQLFRKTIYQSDVEHTHYYHQQQQSACPRAVRNFNSSVKYFCIPMEIKFWLTLSAQCYWYHAVFFFFLCHYFFIFIIYFYYFYMSHSKRNFYQFGIC